MGITDTPFSMDVPRSSESKEWPEKSGVFTKIERIKSEEEKLASKRKYIESMIQELQNRLEAVVNIHGQIENLKKVDKTMQDAAPEVRFSYEFLRDQLLQAMGWKEILDLKNQELELEKETDIEKRSVNASKLADLHNKILSLEVEYGDVPYIEYEDVKEELGREKLDEVA